MENKELNLYKVTTPQFTLFCAASSYDDADKTVMRILKINWNRYKDIINSIELIAEAVHINYPRLNSDPGFTREGEILPSFCISGVPYEESR